MHIRHLETAYDGDVDRDLNLEAAANDELMSYHKVRDLELLIHNCAGYMSQGRHVFLEAAAK